MASPSSPALQRLNGFDRASPDFQNQLSNVLRGEEYIQYVQNLEGNDLAWLVDYLGEVRYYVVPLRSVQTGVGSRWIRSFQFRFPEVFTRTPKHLRH